MMEPRVVFGSADNIETRDLSITSPLLYHYATEPHCVSVQMWGSATPASIGF